MQNPPAGLSVLDWNDLRYFLAVARSGSTLAAAGLLQVSQSTVSRRIDMAESVLHLRLFDRMRTGYVLTEAGLSLLPQAESVEQACTAFETTALALSRTIAGRIRLTTNEMMANAHLDRALVQLSQAYPMLQVDTITGDRMLDLAAGEADIAIRAGLRPSDNALFGRQLTLDSWSLYASPDYVARHGQPASLAEVGAHAFVGLLPGRIEPVFVEMLDTFLTGRRVSVRRDTLTGMLSAIRNGAGLGVMSDFVARDDRTLVRCFGLDHPRPPEIWLLSPERLRHDPRIRLLMDFLVGYFAPRRADPEA